MSSSPSHVIKKRYAVKIIRAKDEEYQRIALREFRLLTKLNHKSIIKMEDAFVNPARETIYLVMEYIEGDTIRKFVKS
jgi:serine/threonine protein kinase